VYFVVAVSLIIVLLYSVLLLRFIKGWWCGLSKPFASEGKGDYFDCKNTADSFIEEVAESSTSSDFTLHSEANLKCPEHLFVSVVVPCRNEATQLPYLISALKAQTCPFFELILVDDHSTDDTLQFMQSLVSEFQTINVLTSSGRGKKQALRKGIDAARAELILTTDADCIPSAGWIETMCKAYRCSYADVLIGPVVMRNTSMSGDHYSRGCFQQLQQLEFATLVASGMAGAAADRAFMANAANLGFKKSVWLQLHKQLQEKQLSGDDVFLIHAVKQHNGLIKAIFDRQAMVVTKMANSPLDFFRQRRRWLSKSPAYRDKDILFTQWVVAAINLLILMLLAASPFNHALFGTLLFVSFIKLLLDAVFVGQFSTFFGIKPGVSTVVLLFVLYPSYVLFTGLTLFSRKSQRW